MAAVSIIYGPGLVSQRIDRYLRDQRQVQPLLDGGSVLAMGVPEGPLVGRILGRLLAARLDHLVESVEDERRLVRSILAESENV
jgi:hypothetical protein